MNEKTLEEKIEFYLDPYELSNKPRRIIQGLEYKAEQMFLEKKVNEKDYNLVVDILDEILPHFGEFVYEKSPTFRKYEDG